MDGTLHTIDITSGELTSLFSTGLTNVIDLAYKIDSNEIWAVTGEAMYSIALDGSEDVKEFPQTFTERHPEERLVGIALNPVQLLCSLLECLTLLEPLLPIHSGKWN